MFKRVAVVGGAGYVGSALVPHLVRRGYEVKVIDLFIYGEDVFAPDVSSSIQRVKLDIRDEERLRHELNRMEAVIHLACISNDPSFELDPKLGKSINYDAFFGLLRAVSACGVQRLIYASSSSVYGVKEELGVHEDMACDPLTEYSRYKFLCEELLKHSGLCRSEYVILRPATVCGYARRLRLDLTVNLLTIHALVKRMITVYGGAQLRPNIHIRDMVEAYRLMLEAPSEAIHGETFNAGGENLPVNEIAGRIHRCLGSADISVRTEPHPDRRSYHISSEKLKRRLEFQARFGVEDAVRDLNEAYEAGFMVRPLDNSMYYNIRRMQEIDLSHMVEV